eukprot:scaffold21118_cov112-Isochrysis_galbana.AAC.6
MTKDKKCRQFKANAKNALPMARTPAQAHLARPRETPGGGRMLQPSFPTSSTLASDHLAREGGVRWGSPADGPSEGAAWRARLVPPVHLQHQRRVLDLDHGREVQEPRLNVEERLGRRRDLSGVRAAAGSGH